MPGEFNSIIANDLKTRAAIAMSPTSGSRAGWAPQFRHANADRGPAFYVMLGVRTWPGTPLAPQPNWRLVPAKSRSRP